VFRLGRATMANGAPLKFGDQVIVEVADVKIHAVISMISMRS
jgi:hypothetical protein